MKQSVSGSICTCYVSGYCTRYPAVIIHAFPRIMWNVSNDQIMCDWWLIRLYLQLILVITTKFYCNELDLIVCSHHSRKFCNINSNLLLSAWLKIWICMLKMAMNGRKNTCMFLKNKCEMHVLPWKFSIIAIELFSSVHKCH